MKKQSAPNTPRRKPTNVSFNAVEDIKMISPVKSPHKPYTQGTELPDYPPWTSRETRELFEKAQELEAKKKTDKARSLLSSYYHNEALEFTTWAQLTPKELSLRLSILSELESLIKSHIPLASVALFGSTANRLALPGSDIDILISLPLVTVSHTYGLLYESIVAILQGSDLVEQVEAIRTAAVPIVQARHKATGISVDIVIEREDGLQGLCLVMALQKAYVELRPIYIIVKAMVSYKQVHKPWRGGVGSFVLINMIVSYLQHKLYKPKALGTLSTEPTLPELVIGFLRFFGEDLNMRRVGLSILGGGYLFDRRDDSLACGESNSAICPMIKSPLVPTDDLGTSVRQFQKILRPLFNAAAYAMMHWFAAPESDDDPYSESNKEVKRHVSFVEMLLPEARKMRK
ncbi:hypothetical protein FGO68_gene9181 [Halteria grandinella]|uniref:Poly(A) RNA polymerase mitochondrial-like central palm domain-containing protein n=1 Tax=Halteria grandinella TaxID=5974 RepID=A0A8J8NPS4_HALGN|nr:hypothetical protein FGO68_gene9181 [Halteria grandinella]